VGKLGGEVGWGDFDAFVFDMYVFRVDLNVVEVSDIVEVSGGFEESV